MNLELDNSLIGLTKEKMQKVSTFRTNINMALLDADSTQSLQPCQAVKYLHSTKFDLKKAEDVFHNYQRHKEHYKPSPQGQVLNEMRSRKLEVLGTRDSKGALLLLYTASRHTSKSHDCHTAMQLFFLILDQISESTENQLKGITLIMDMRECHAHSFDNQYATSLFSLLSNGYPLFVNTIYIVDSPSWFKSHHKISSYSSLHKQGKIKHCTVSGLSSLIPSSSLPQSMGGTHVLSMSSFVPSSEAVPHSLSPTHGSGMPLTPPTRKPRPVLVQSSNGDESCDSALLQSGSVNKIKEKFASQAPPTHGSPVASSKSSPSHNKSKINGVNMKGLKPLPPPRVYNHSHHIADSLKTKVPIFPPNSRSHFVKSKSLDESDEISTSTKSSITTKSKELKSLPETVTSSKSTPSSTPPPRAAEGKGRGLNKKVEAVSSTKNPIVTISKGVAKSNGGPGHSTGKDEDTKKAVKYVSKGQDKPQQTPPPSYNPPSPPSEDTESHSKPKYVNMSVFQPTTSPPAVATPTPKAAPYMVTTISTSEPKATPTNATPTNATPSSSTIPKSETNIKKRPNLYENVFFTKEVEDEGECLDEEFDDENIYENFGPDEGHKWMGVVELEQYIGRKGKTGLSSEYYKIKNDPLSGSARAFRSAGNTSKNRYKDVVCYDATRVLLNEMENREGSDYIHANYVNGFEKKQAFIITQGPLKRTVNDYWRMLWEQEVFVVVMTTKCVEMGKLKCAQYWPDHDKPPIMFGNICVSVVEHQQKPSFEFRKLSVECEGETRTVMHFQFTAWPDYGVPATGKEVVDLLYTARETQERFGEYLENPQRFPVYGPPLVIHCSAGIGRSGTFCALDYCIDELRVKGRVNIQHCVRLLRQQRAFAIQTDEQYRFCYNTVLEYGQYLKEVLKL